MQAAFVEALEEADVAVVGDPGLRAVEKSGDCGVVFASVSPMLMWGGRYFSWRAGW